MANKTKLRRALRRRTARIEIPSTYQARYFKALVTHTQNVMQVFDGTVMRTLKSYERRQGSLTDSLTDELADSWIAFARRVGRLKSKQLAESAFEKTAEGLEIFHRRQFVANIKREIGVDVQAALKEVSTKRVVDAALVENIELIKTISDSVKDRASSIITDGLTAGRDYQSIRKSLLDLGGFKEQYAGTEIRRARTIARDQTQKFFNAIDRVRQTDVGIKKYTWRTSRDERVRDDHKANDGKTFSWGKPPKTGHPGHDVNCRCYAEPDLNSLLKS